MAKYFDVATIGTLGLLIIAKNSGLITVIKPLINELEKCEFYMSKSLKEKALLLAGE